MSDDYTPPPADDDDPMYEANETDEPAVDDDREFGKCAHCHTAIPVLGPVVCSCCLRLGACPVCGVLHGGAAMCPAVRKVWAEQEAIERAMQGQMVATAALAIRERYLRDPIWKEAA